MNFTNLAQYIIESNTLGLIEDIIIAGIGKMKAKTDTGNEAYNVLHGVNIKVEDDFVVFNCESGARVKLPLKETIKVHYGKGNVDNRPVALCDCVINGKKYFKVPFSITDRSSNSYKVLLGQDFIKFNGGMVNVNKTD